LEQTKDPQMIFLAKLILDSLHGVDPLIFVGPICLGLGVCFIVLLAELETTRLRWRDNAMKRRCHASQSAAQKNAEP
jgi:hypothetical protein